jgi:hypothetical protein
MMAKQVQIRQNEIPEGWSAEAADFANKVIIKKNLYLSYYKESLQID